MNTIASSIKSEHYKVEIDVTGAPAVDNEFGGQAEITGLSIIYNDRKAAVIRFHTSDDDLFMQPTDMDDPGNWPSWLRDLVAKYQPAA
ncbi:hypothetical protein [Streptomyces sp. NPDC059928]|uniref:hypothetical protein n=1 Tax=unclassified Streptomyces TaxID=2593676 RepID=UPI003662A30F